MAATPTLLTSGTSVNASATTASVSPTSGRLLELDVIATRDANAVGQTDLSVSGLGATWVLVAFLQYGTRRGIWRYRCQSDGTSGTIALTYAPGGQHAETGWALKEWSGQVAGNNGADAVGTPVSDTAFGTALALGTVGALSAGDAVSAVFGIESDGAAGAFEASYAELVDQIGTNANIRQMLVGWDDADVTASASWTGSSSAGGVANRIIAGASGISGTLAVAEAADTLAAAGTSAPPPVTGSLAATEADDSLAAAGTVTGAGVTGTISVTEQADTLAAAGTADAPGLDGTLAVTEQPDILTAAGAVAPPAYTGTLSITEVADTLTAAGATSTPEITGALAATEASDTLTAAGAVVNQGIAGSLATVEASDTLAAAASFDPGAKTGTLVVSEVDDTLSASALVTVPAGTPGITILLAPLVATLTQVPPLVPTATAAVPAVPTAGGAA